MREFNCLSGLHQVDSSLERASSLLDLVRHYPPDSVHSSTGPLSCSEVARRIEEQLHCLMTALLGRQGTERMPVRATVK